jgi:hypothetical protein
VHVKSHGCGYDPCPCCGINFISRYQYDDDIASDYCIDGKRVTLRDSSPLVHRATAEEVNRLSIFLLQRYADYIQWHVANKQKAPNWSVSLQPFNYPWPLVAKENR